MVDDWLNCYEIFRKNCPIDKFYIKETVFTQRIWMNSHNNAFYFDDIKYLHYSNEKPIIERIFVDVTGNGGKYLLASGASVNLASNDNSAHYMICGKNLFSNDPDDVSVGSVSGAVGNVITRTEDASFASALSVDNECLVFTQPNNTKNKDIWLKVYAVAEEEGIARLQCTLKNVGQTSGASFKAYIAVVDGETKKVIRKDADNARQASAEGTITSYNTTVSPGDLVVFYIYCSSPVANSVTKLENCLATIYPVGWDNFAFEKFKGSHRDGDGTISTIEGVNNIMSSANSFRATFKSNNAEGM